MKINDIITETAKRPGLWANIHAKQKRIKSGSGERMRKPGSKGAPSDADLKASRTEAVDAGQKRLGPDKNDPWEQGWRAAHRRQDETACPYERGSKEHARWMDGYDEGWAQPNHYDESVNESSAAADDVSGTLNSHGYYTKNAQDYVHDKTGDKFQREGSQWKHQSGVKGRGPDELAHFLSSKQGVTEGERTMSRAAKGNEKYGKDGMKALAKAGREGAGEKKLDAIRSKYDNYSEDIEEAANPAQQAAIAVNMKQQHKKPEHQSVAENNWSHDPWKDKYFGPTAGALKKIFKVTVQDDESNVRAFNVKAETEKQAMEIIEKHVPGATVKKIKFVQNLMVGRP
jgi:hypothetical protein